MRSADYTAACQAPPRLRLYAQFSAEFTTENSDWNARRGASVRGGTLLCAGIPLSVP